MVSHVRSVIPGVALSTDMIVGFCGETEAEFEETLSLMREVRFHRQFIFQYRYFSTNPGKMLNCRGLSESAL